MSILQENEHTLRFSSFRMIVTQTVLKVFEFFVTKGRFLATWILF